MDVISAMRTKKILTTALFLIIIVLTLLVFFSLQRSRAAAIREQDSLTATGSLEAVRVTASFKVAGKIEEMLVDEGSRVEQGQELAYLESRELNAKLSQASGAYDAASAQARQADVGPLAPSESTQVDVRGVKIDIPGSQHVWAFADFFSQEEESDETDNVFALPFSIAGPDLTIPDASAPATGA